MEKKLSNLFSSDNNFDINIETDRINLTVRSLLMGLTAPSYFMPIRKFNNHVKIGNKFSQVLLTVSANR